jgi:hypothetical protein
MKVIIANHRVCPFHGCGGIEKYPYYLSKYLIEKGIDVQIFTSSDKGKEKTETFWMFHIFYRALAFVPNDNGIKHKVLSSRYKAGFLYELKLATDKNLREIIMKECWLE